MRRKKASFRRRTDERRHRDAVMEGLRLRDKSPADSLRALSAHNEAVIRLNRLRR
jgi:hypothetical protein